jgi:hypothetical protein
MATTRLTDIIQHPKEFLSTVDQKLTDLSVMRKAGVIVNDAALAERAAGAGKITSIPFYNPLTQNESAVGSDDPAVYLAADKIGQGEQIAARHFRNRAWSSADLVAQLGSDDPMDAIARRLAEFWAQDEERMVIAVLNGLLANNAAVTDSYHTQNDMVSNSAGTGNLSLDMLIDAVATMGDAGNVLDTLLIHSTVYRNLQKGQANAFVPKAATDIGFATYGGYKLVVTDLMPKNGSVYTSAVVSSGVVLNGSAPAKNPVAVVRDELAGNGSGIETLVNRRQFVMHPNGYQFIASPAGASATNTELAAAATWQRAYNRKNIPLAFIKTAG